MTKWKMIAAAAGAGMLTVAGMAVSVSAGASDASQRESMNASYTNNGGSAFILKTGTQNGATCPGASSSGSDAKQRQGYLYTQCGGV